MEPPPPEGERVLSILTARLLEMPASAFATSGDAAIPRLPTVELRDALRQVAARSAQAAAVARLARVSRGSNQLAAASALPAPTRSARREKLAALSGVCAAPRAGEMLGMESVQEALVATCAQPEGADEAAHWREVAAAAHKALVNEPNVGERLLMTMNAGAYLVPGEPPGEADISSELLQWRAWHLVAALTGDDGYVSQASSQED